MKRTDKITPTATVEAEPLAKSNGQTTAGAELVAANMSVILASLQTMRDGDFSVRLPGNWTGLAGKIADTFNDIVAANQQMAKELKRRTQKSLELKSLNPEHPDRMLASEEVVWVARIVWASQ